VSLEGNFRYARDEWLQIAEVPLTEHLHFLIVLPDPDHSLEELQSRLPDLFHRWNALLTARPVSIRLPPFHISTSLALDDVLRELGMSAPFETVTDFAGLFGTPGLHLAHFAHSSRIDWSGRYLATRTLTNPKPAPLTIEMNRPFVYAITEPLTGAILLLGHVADAHEGPASH
jgi:serpin B